MAPHGNKLEKAIKASKVGVTTTENAVVIDRVKYASRKRGKLSTISSCNSVTEGDLESNENESNSDVQFWRDKYDQLYGQKTEAEIDLEKQLRLSREQVKSQQECIKLLEKKVHVLEGNNSSSKNENALIEFYEKMTSMEVAAAKDNSGNDCFTCTLKNQLKRTVTRFLIHLATNSDGESVLQFEPKANVAMLPSYLQNNISCEVNMAPVVMGDILQNLYDGEEE